MLYHAYQAQAFALTPMRMLAEAASVFFTQRIPAAAVAIDCGPFGPPLGMPLGSSIGPAATFLSGNEWAARMGAACEVFVRSQLTHVRPSFDIPSVEVLGKDYAVIEEEVVTTPFAGLLHFRKDGAPEQPRVLLVAPLSGHFATLLRDTVRVLLADHDVYVTDWYNARDVSVEHGRFGLDEYVDHMMKFLRYMGPGVHVMAICQPCVAALASVAMLAQDNDPAQPASMTLMAGPIDCRVNPTSVNKMANQYPIDWFEKNLISTVPLPHAGASRRVYPGVVQLSAFMNMNLTRHVKMFGDLYNHRWMGEHDKADAIAKFYEEYFAVNDLTAEFYLETVERVFQRYDLPLGKLMYKGQKIEPKAIVRTALMTVEGERDDICSIGQTVAAQDICVNIRPYKRTHHVQTGVGHYGVFSGSKWARSIYPRVREMIHQTTQ